MPQRSDVISVSDPQQRYDFGNVPLFGEIDKSWHLHNPRVAKGLLPLRRFPHPGFVCIAGAAIIIVNRKFRIVKQRGAKKINRRGVKNYPRELGKEAKKCSVQCLVESSQ